MKTIVAVLLLCFATALPGCGADGGSAVEGATLGPECRPAGRTAAGAVHLCYRAEAQDHGRFAVVDPDGQQRTLAVKSPTQIGHWGWAAVSPDGAAILAEWSAECEVPIAFLVSTSGGRPRPAFASDAASRAFGWTVDGRAIVSLLTQTPCSGRILKPGLYLVPPEGRGTLVGALRPSPARSLRPRTLKELADARTL